MTESTGAVGSRAYPHHYETAAFVRTSMASLFAHVDDHERLSSHMSEASWMMGGGSMQIASDEGCGQRVGSRIRVNGRVWGIQLSLEEAVVERDPPCRKAWETTSSPRLLVIGHYRMGFEIAQAGDGAQLCVFIDYALPDTLPGRWLGYLFGASYAKWCTRRMVRDAVTHFNDGKEKR